MLTAVYSAATPGCSAATRTLQPPLTPPSTLSVVFPSPCAAGYNIVSEHFKRWGMLIRKQVRHVLTIPSDDYAYNANGNIAFFGGTSAILDVAIHETGHSLDLLGAYGDVLSCKSFPCTL